MTLLTETERTHEIPGLIRFDDGKDDSKFGIGDTTPDHGADHHEADLLWIDCQQKRTTVVFHWEGLLTQSGLQP